MCFCIVVPFFPTAKKITTAKIHGTLDRSFGPFGGQAVTDVGFQMVLPEQDADLRGGSFKTMKKASQREQDLGGGNSNIDLEFSPLYTWG